ncbi:MAG: hypothetical protein M0R49_05545, partial [Limnochordia bacterium]|nr:hypothetical protein [Limnochordia bacterium]
TTTLDLMLAETKDQKELPFTEERAEVLVTQQYQGEADDTARPAKQLITIKQPYYHGGQGQENLDNIYKSGYGVSVDTRVKGKVILGPLVNSASTLDIDILNKTQEDWYSSSVPYNCTSNGTVARSTDSKTGTYCSQITGSVSELTYYRAWTCPKPSVFRSKEITITVWVKTAMKGITARITDSAGTTYATTGHTGGGDYEQLTVTRTIDASATYIYFDVVSYMVTLSDSGFEDWTDATTLNVANWPAPDAGTITRSPATKHEGTYSCMMDPNKVVTMHQDAATWNNALRGVELTLTTYLYSVVADNIRIGVSDGHAATTYSAYNDGDSDWDATSVTITPDTSADKLRWIIEKANNANAAYVDGTTTLVRTDTPVFKVDVLSLSVTGGLTHTFSGTPLQDGIFEFNSRLYLCTTKELCRWDETNSKWYVVFHAETVSSDTAFTHCYPFGGYIFIALGIGNAWYQSSVTEVFAVQTQSNTGAEKFGSNGVTLWYNDAVNKVRSSSNPGSNPCTVSSQTTLGDAGVTINASYPLGGSMFFGESNGLMYIDSTGAAATGARCVDLASSENFIGMRVWESGGMKLLYCPMGLNGLYIYEDTYGTMTNVAPAVIAPRYADFHGQISCMAPSSDWMYVVSEPTGSNTKSKLMTVRYESIMEQSADWVWHMGLAEIDLNPVNCCAISTLQASNPRLWLAGSKSGTVGIYYIILSRYGDPTQDTNYKYASSGTLYSSNKYTKIQGDDKVFFYQDIEVDNISTGHQTITPSYDIGGSGSWTALTAPTADGVTRTYLATDKTGKYISNKFAFATDDSTKTPVLIQDAIGCRLNVTPYSQFELTVKASGGQITNSGTASILKSSVALETAIRAMAAEHYVKMTHYIGDGNTSGISNYVTIVPPSPKMIATSRRDIAFKIIGLYAPTS